MVVLNYRPIALVHSECKMSSVRRPIKPEVGCLSSVRQQIPFREQGGKEMVLI